MGLNALNQQYKGTQPNLSQLLAAFEQSLNCNMNCVKVAKIVTFDPISFTAHCRVMNKRMTGLNDDGTQVLKEYPPIYAKVHYIGWGDIGITHPINEGMEGLLLFNDRELETWYLTGENGQLANNNTHDLSDAIFICGLISRPHLVEDNRLIQYLDNCLNLYYKKGNMQISDGTITINGNTTINGNLVVNGTIKATGDIVSGSISLLNHVHGNGNQGADTTKPK